MQDDGALGNMSAQEKQLYELISYYYYKHVKENKY
jgi:hypothetical protein